MPIPKPREPYKVKEKDRCVAAIYEQGAVRHTGQGRYGVKVERVRLRCGRRATVGDYCYQHVGKERF